MVFLLPYILILFKSSISKPISVNNIVILVYLWNKKKKLKKDDAAS